MNNDNTELLRRINALEYELSKVKETVAKHEEKLRDKPTKESER